MLIEDEFKAIYLNYKVKEIILFLGKLIPKEKEKIIVILKKHQKKHWGHNTVSMLATLACSKNKGTIEHCKVLKFCLNAANLTFSKDHSRVFSKDKTFSGTAFEALINRAVVADFYLSVLGLLIGEKINFGLAQVKKITDGFSVCINLSTEHNQAFEKLIISILTAIKNPVFNLKKLLKLYYELIRLNHSVPNEALIEKLKEWEKENNLKKIIHQIKD